MKRDGFGGNVGKWTVLFVFLCLVGACAGLKGGIDKNRPGNGEPEVLEAPIINPKPPREVERDPIPIPPQEEVVHTEPEPTGSVPDIEETRPTPTPSRPTGKPSPRPGTGNKPAAQKPPVDEPVAETPASSLNADDYTAVLDVTETMELHQKGDLRVWIGIENYNENYNIPEEEPDMVRKTTTFPGDEGNYARITPYAPDFRIEPKDFDVMRITPSGGSVLFTIIPQKKGEFKISAKIELFDNPNFDGVPIPKTTNIVSVVVTVDPKVNLMARLGQMGTVLWDNFLKFWGAVVALIFGALFFVTRKFIKKKTGFTGNGIESSSLSGGSESAPSEGKEMPEEAGSESGEEEGETEVGEDDEVPDYFDVGEGGE